MHLRDCSISIFGGGGWGGPDVGGCILRSHEGFVDHRRAMKEARKWTLLLLLLILHSHGQPFFRKEIQVKHSQVLTEHWRQFPPSVKWLKPSPAEQLPAFSERPPPTPLLHHRPAQLASVTTSQRVVAPSRTEKVTTAALLWDVIWN